jgi:hypothetical protein
MKHIKLTLPQLATLAYIEMKCEVVTGYPGSLPLQNLAKIGFLKVRDASWGNYKKPWLQSWTLTLDGLTHLKTHHKKAALAMDKMGWLLI